MTNTTKQTTTNATTFGALLREYEQTAHNRKSDACGIALQNLGTAVAYSVLGKCIDPTRKTDRKQNRQGNAGQSPALLAMRRGIAHDRATLANIQTTCESAYELTFTKDGDLVTAVADKETQSALDTLMAQTIGDGYDLVDDAIVAILAETDKAIERGDIADGWMERAYKVRRLNRKVWIKVEDSVNGWETADTTAITEIYKAVRRTIAQNGAPHIDPRSKYTYLEDIAIDEETGAGEAIYQRFGKYANLGGYATDINGDTDYNSACTVDKQTAIDYADTLERLGLTERQAQIVSLRMSGNGTRAIATYLGISDGNVCTILARLRDKCERLGFTPAMWAEMTATE